jgi:hypothetical protein
MNQPVFYIAPKKKRVNKLKMVGAGPIDMMKKIFTVNNAKSLGKTAGKKILDAVVEEALKVAKKKVGLGKPKRKTAVKKTAVKKKTKKK